MKAIIVKNNYTTYNAKVYGASQFAASCTAGQEQAAKACVRKWYGGEAAETVRLVTDQKEMKEIIDPAHFVIATGRDTYVFFFNEAVPKKAKSVSRKELLAIAVETEVLAPEADLPKAEITACNALHTLVTGRAVEARKAAETACHYAVLLGIKLKALKAATPHGGWEVLFTNGKTKKLAGGEVKPNPERSGFAFSSDTALNYIKAGEGALARPGLPAAAKKAILALASKEEVPDTLPAAASKALDKATAGATLRQLYIDLDIMRAPATAKSGMGGNKGKKEKTAPVNSEDDLWEVLAGHFEPVTLIVERGDLTQLSGPRLNELETLLRSWLDELKKISRK
jgi:hypothetical protein